MSEKEQTAVEAERTQAEIDAEVACKLAEAEKHHAEARKFDAEAREADWQAREAEYSSGIAAVRMREKEREEAVDIASHAEWLAQDALHYTYQFVGAVDSSSVKNCMKQLSTWDRIHPKCPMEIVFHSPGGSVIDGMALFDFIQDMRHKDHTVTTTTRGYAASMAGVLLQAGDVRRMGREAYILIHEVAFGTVGKIGEVEDQVAFARKIQERILSIFADRSGGKISKAQLRKNWLRKDWWLDSDEALKLGLVDEVV